MIEVGKVQELMVTKRVEQGLYLNEKEIKERDILLPNNQVPEEIQIGETITVFVYRNSRDRKIATLNRPRLMIG